MVSFRNSKFYRSDFTIDNEDYRQVKTDKFEYSPTFSLGVICMGLREYILC